ncbi:MULTISPECIES: hypothetical protein [Enterobacteriaceae]|uniref:hypothetical protein n=1 Tax=Enterobacteriaceae TaxID=543 RepID=UPI0010CB977D|nr:MULTISPECIES: hypothetical protein [Enterobacteriaceae]MDW2649201.1 hypothetical protein [Citrobacter portucalensis]GCP17025.1 hypothetical protein ExPECSC043_00220 [Escherichia coli]
MKIKNEISAATILSIMMFISVYAFKSGEAMFFGYPSYYIYLDTNEVINTLLKLSFVIITLVTLSLFIRIPTKFFILFIAVALITKFIRIAVLSHQQSLNGMAVINVGTSFIIFICLLYLIPNVIKQETGYYTLNAKPFVFALIAFLSFSYFFGLNYHSFFPGGIWQTDDERVVVGRYQDKFILRQCNNGKALFYISEISNNKFEKFKIDTRNVLLLRCQTEFDAMKKTESMVNW